MASSSSSNNETVHISLGNTANHITSHLLNLQGLAATAPQNESGGGSGSGEDASAAALCDPSVTHDISPLDSDYYSGSSSSSRYMYVPRTLIVDGRDSFGSSWGGVSSHNNSYGAGGATAQHCQTSPTSSSYSPNIPSLNDPNASVSASTWDGAVKIFDASEHSAILFGDQASSSNNDARQPPRHQNHTSERATEDDPLNRFHNAASMMGLSPLHSRFNAAPSTQYSSYSMGGGNNSSDRHVQWDEEEEEAEEEEDDYYSYGQDRERVQEEKRRQLERMEYQKVEARRNWNSCMADAFEEAFYGSDQQRDISNDVDGGSMSLNSNNEGDKTPVNHATNDEADGTTAAVSNAAANQQATQREIQWYDYWMPPKPSPTKYQVPLPFDTSISSNGSSNASNKNATTWSSSFNMGYNPASGGGGGSAMSSGLGGDDSAGITHSWREHVLSESLRKVLEGCDVVKGFNVYVDGGNPCGGLEGSNSSGSLPGGGNKHAKKLLDIIAGGGFHAGLATSLLEELSEECRSAGRWVVMVDPFSSSNNTNGGANNNTEGNQIHHFRQCLNSGLALHGLSSNADAFLPVSIDGAYRALRGLGGESTSQNRILFEGSAATALALETSTLFYRLHRHHPSSHSSGDGMRGHGRHHRSRIGIQSGFYQGYGGGSAGYEDCDNEPYATAPSLTYHEFLACARPSSDRRRSILELDALLRPISYPSTVATGGGELGSGLNVASLLAGNAGGMSSSSASVLASLASAGIIAGGTTNNNAPGELQKRMEKGTSIERMRVEQRQQQYWSSRGGRSSSSRQSEPGEWLEDFSSNSGLLSSLSGNSTPFGRRAEHHHFALSASLRPAASDVRSSSFASNPGGCGGASSAFLRPMMESMGVKYRPEVSLGAVVKDTVADLTGVGSYWRAIFTDRNTSSSPPASASGGNVSSSSIVSPHQQQKNSKLSPRDFASHTPILSILGNSTRSYPRLSTISTGFVDSLHSRRNMGYLSRDVMAGIVPEKDDCEEALEYCRELVDVYEPPMGSGLVVGEDENDDLDAYFDDEN